MIRKYSGKTLDELARFLNVHLTHTEIDSLFLYVSVPDGFDYGPNKLARSISVLKKLSRSEDPEHGKILDELFNEAIKRNRKAFERSEHSVELQDEAAASLWRALKADGLEVVEGRIVPADRLELELTTEASILDQKMQAHGMTDITRLLDQAHQNFIEGRFEACNAMLRSSLEGTLKHIATIVAGAPGKIPARNSKHGPTPADIRKYLRQEGFFEEDEIEYIRVFYGYASTDGSHPGISSESESRLRRLMIVALIQYCMEKLESRY